MSEQQVTEVSNPCIADAPKSLGQVGYEAMLTTPDGIAAASGFARAFVLWEGQTARVRECWETIATAIEIAVKEQVVKEVAEQMGARATAADQNVLRIKQLENKSRHDSECIEQLTRVRNAHADEIERLRAENAAALEYDKSMRRQLSELRAENEAIRKSIGDGDYGPTAAELQRYRDREPLVEKVLNWNIVGYEKFQTALAAVRDCKVTP